MQQMERSNPQESSAKGCQREPPVGFLPCLGDLGVSLRMGGGSKKAVGNQKAEGAEGAWVKKGDHV